MCAQQSLITFFLFDISKHSRLILHISQNQLFPQGNPGLFYREMSFRDKNMDVVLLTTAALVILSRRFSMDRVRFHIYFEAKTHCKFIQVLLTYIQDNGFFCLFCFHLISLIVYLVLPSHMLKCLDSINITITPLFHPTSHTQQSQNNTTVVDCCY